MPTLRFAQVEDMPPDDAARLERLAKRMGLSVLDLPGIRAAQAHWPALLEANEQVGRYGFKLQGTLPRLTKEAMHVAVSMVNGCDY